jgi:PKD repeat protein
VDYASKNNSGGGSKTFYDMGSQEYGATKSRVSFMVFPLYARQPPGKFQFINFSPSTVFTSWKWDFGDGTTSTERAPVHVYANVDTYTVKLIGYSAAGNDTLIRTNYLSVRGTPLGMDEVPQPEPQLAVVHVLPEPMTNFLTFILNERMVTSHATVAIFNSEGQLVRRLTSAGGHDVTARVMWNGQDAMGQQVKPGVYMYTIGNGQTIAASGKFIKVK